MFKCSKYANLDWKMINIIRVRVVVQFVKLQGVG